jgi:hypothetical protein
VSKRNLLYPPMAAAHWNIDNKPHNEFWPSTDLWAIQK